MFVLLWTCFNAQTCACYSRNYTQIRLTVLGEWIIFWKKCGSSANVTYIPPVCVNFGTEHFFCCRLNIFDRWSEWHWSLCYNNSCGSRIHMDVTYHSLREPQCYTVFKTDTDIWWFQNQTFRYMFNFLSLTQNIHKFEGKQFVYATETALWWTHDATSLKGLKGVSLIYFSIFSY